MVVVYLEFGTHSNPKDIIFLRKFLRVFLDSIMFIFLLQRLEVEQVYE